MKTVSMFQTIKYYLKTRGLSSASFYDASRDNYAMNTKLYRSMKLAVRKRIENISMAKRAGELEKLKMKQRVLATKPAHRVDFEKKHVNKIACVL